MANRTSDWVFNLGLRLGVVVFLGTLALGLLAGLEPVTALTRSGVAFVAFVLLAHAASAIWRIYSTDETTKSIAREGIATDREESSLASEVSEAGQRNAQDEAAS